jgi:AcrR family transcriptional regulator
MNHDFLPESASRKEREKRARQLEILRAARELFVSKGFRDTTLEEIAQHAEFGKGTLYNYFAGKEDLFFGILEQAIEETLAIAQESLAAPGGVREKLTLYARNLIHYVKDNGELLHVLYHELHRNDSPATTAKLRQILNRTRSTWDLLAEPLRNGIEEHALRDCDPVQLAILFDGMLRGFCFHRFSIERSHRDEDFSAAAECITSVFLDGIAVRKSKG